MAGRLNCHHEINSVPHQSASRVVPIPEDPIVPHVLVLIEKLHYLFPGDVKDHYLHLPGHIYPHVHSQLLLSGVKEVLV